MENRELWDRLRTPPDDALREIRGGRLKGKKDINPVWRMEAMTEAFGTCGIGWRYDVTDIIFRDGSDGQVVCMVRVDLQVRQGEAWSEIIPGVGGSMFIENEKGGLYTNDEALKMAVTDALSVAMKALGVAADVYRGLFDGKHSRPRSDNGNRPAPNGGARRPDTRLVCPTCNHSGMWPNLASPPDATKDNFRCADRSCAVTVWAMDKQTGDTNPGFVYLWEIHQGAS